MQTAVDRNGSSSNSNTSITTTTTTTLMETSSAELLSRDGGNAAATSTRSTPPVILAPVTMLEQPNVLRHRLQVGVGVGVSVGGGGGGGGGVGLAKATPTAAGYACTTAASAHKNGSGYPLIDVAEYLGSNVERMSVTPSPSPHASPSKKTQSAHVATADGATAEATDTTATKLSPVAAAAHATDIAAHGHSNKSSLSSSASSSSNSTTSSVIASPVLARNGNAFVQDINDNATVVSGDGCDDCSTTTSPRRDTTYINSGLPLPPRSATFSTFSSTACNETLSAATPTSLTSSSSNSLSPLAATNSTTTTTTATASTTTLNTASSTPTIDYAPAAKPLKSSEVVVPLLRWQDMPKYLQFNPYVLNGYRPLQTFKGCLLSLFYWHNETINILTHAIPIVYILAIVPGLMPWEREYRFLSFCHLFGSVAPWCGSFVYHLFMNIERGENVYYTLLKLDMVGIWVSQSFGALPLVTATTFCFSAKWKWFIIISYCLLSLWGLYKALTASSPWQRRLCFALPFTMRSILTLLRTMGLGGGNPIALSHVYLQDGVSILGGAIGAMRIPEKWFPGLVDFYLNSHNIMHVLVVVAVYSMHKATIKDFEWMSATSCDAITNATGQAIETTFTSNTEL